MIISWDGGTLTLEDAWIEDKTKTRVYTRRTITGSTVVFLPVYKRYTVRINTCTYEEATLLKSLAESGTKISIDDEGFLISGVIKELDIKHFVDDVKESAIRNRINLYRGKMVVEAEP